MKLKSKISYIIICIFLFASAFSIIAMAQNSNNSSKIYSLDKSIVSSDNIKIMQYNTDTYILISCIDNQTSISKLNPKNGSLTQIKKIDKRYISSIISNNSLYVAFTSGSSYKKTNIYSLDLSKNTFNDNLIPISDIEISCQEDFTADNLGNLFLIDGSDNTTVKEFSNEGEPLFNYNYYGGLSGLSKTPLGYVFSSTADHGNLVKLSDGKITNIDGSNVNDKINFLDENHLIDESATAYKLDSNTKISLMYETLAEPKAICAYDDNTLISIGKTVYNLDETGTAISQFSLSQNYNTDILVSNSDSIISLCCLDDGRVIAEVFYQSFEPVTYNTFENEGVDFISAPRSGEVKIDDISKKDNWSIDMDKQKLSASRGNPSVIITDNNSAKVWERTVENGLYISANKLHLEFSPPDEILEHTYTVKIKDLCDSFSKPAMCQYSITFKSTPIPPVPSNVIKSNIYNINRASGIISNIQPATTITELKSNLIYDGEIKINNFTGSPVTSGKIGTGATISLVRNDTLLDKLTVVIYGDLNGDGTVSASDVSRISDHILHKDLLTGVFLTAADANHDGIVDCLDAVTIQDHNKGRKLINQDDNAISE